MSRAAIVRRCSQVVLGAALAATLGACGCQVLDGGTDADADAAVCDVVGYAHRELMVPDGTTFEELVTAADPTEDQQAIGATLVCLDDDDQDLGAYAPAIEFLAERFVAADAAADPSVQDRAEPEATDAVVQSAVQLDRDLGDGLCPP